MYKALLVPTEGDMTEVHISGYKQLQQHVGGVFDCVHIERQLGDRPVGFDMWVNDEGLLLKMGLNPRASLIAGRTIVGPAVLTGAPSNTGNATSVTQPTIDFARAVHIAVTAAMSPVEGVATLEADY